MANELLTVHATGKHLYGVVVNSAGEAWNGAAFEAIVNAHWATYANALAEQGTTGIYLGNFPSAITAADTYNVLLYVETTPGTAAVGDALDSRAPLVWDGNSVVNGALSYAPIGSTDSATRRAETLADVPNHYNLA